MPYSSKGLASIEQLHKQSIPPCRAGLSVLEGDGIARVAALASDISQNGARHVDLAFVDAFDGDDCVPSAMCTPGRKEHLRKQLKNARRGAPSLCAPVDTETRPQSHDRLEGRSCSALK